MRMRKLSPEQVGVARQNQVYMFSPSSDPYVALILYVDAAPLQQLIAARRETSGKPITMVHVFNKLLGKAFIKHPEFNSVVLDRKIYELETVTISNPYLLPGAQHALTMLLIDQPQDMSLEDISDKFDQLREKKLAEFEENGQTKIGFAPKFYIRSGLFRIISEKFQFRTIYERDLTTNLVLSKANGPQTSNFIATKSATQILRAFTRFFQHSPIEQAHVVDGQLAAKTVVPLTMILDHRLVDGYHVNAFVRTINEITADAQNQL